MCLCAVRCTLWCVKGLGWGVVSQTPAPGQTLALGKPPAKPNPKPQLSHHIPHMHTHRGGRRNAPLRWTQAHCTDTEDRERAAGAVVGSEECIVRERGEAWGRGRLALAGGWGLREGLLG